MAVLRFVVYIIPLSRMIKARFYDYIVMKIRTSGLTIFVETGKLMIFHIICYANYIVELKVKSDH